MKKYTLGMCLVSAVMSGFLIFGLAAGVQAQGNKPTDDIEKLKKDYAAVVLDRDNLLIQVKGLVDFRTKYLASENDFKKFEAEKDKIKVELEAVKNQNMRLLERIGEIETAQAQLVKERDGLKNSLEKMGIEYKIVPETKKEISRLQSSNTVLQKQAKQMEVKVKHLEDKKLNLEAQLAVYRMQVKDARIRYEKAMVKNKQLEKKAQALPTRFAEIARENKILIKETALMHYNLGVFYTKNKEYSRAIAEFEKAVELNPDDPTPYFNLGYIYAEYVLNRPLAIEKFRKYLSLVKTEDKDVDWVKRYILTWQTWEGKKPSD
jgi:chromosome segregation protein